MGYPPSQGEAPGLISLTLGGCGTVLHTWSMVLQSDENLFRMLPRGVVSKNLRCNQKNSSLAVHRSTPIEWSESPFTAVSLRPSTGIAFWELLALWVSRHLAHVPEHSCACPKWGWPLSGSLNQVHMWPLSPSWLLAGLDSLSSCPPDRQPIS